MMNQKKKPLSFGETQRLSNDQTLKNCSLLDEKSQPKDLHNDNRFILTNESDKPIHELELSWSSPDLKVLNQEMHTDFPVHSLPEIIRNAVIEVINYTQAPWVIATSSALSVASLATQGLVDIQRDNSLSGPICMFFLTIGESGERKTSCDKYFNKSIRELQAEQNIIRSVKNNEFEILTEEWTAKKKKLLSISNGSKGDSNISEEEKSALLLELESQKPILEKIPNYLLCDETPESLTWRLNFEWPSQAIISSESGIVFGAASMKKEAIVRTLGIYNTIWDDAASYSVGRKGSQSYYLEKARLTLSFQIQPSVFELFMDQTGDIARGSGFLSRFLIAKPLSTQGSRFYQQAPANWPGLDIFNNRIKELLKTPLSWSNNIISPNMLALSTKAKSLWIDFHDLTEANLKEGSRFSQIRDIASKAADNVARLAAIFHVFSHGPEGDVDEESMLRAIELVSWYLNEAVLLFTNHSHHQQQTDAEKLIEKLINICRENNALAILKTYAYQYTHLRSAKELNPVLATLINANCVNILQFQNSTYIAVNPDLL